MLDHQNMGNLSKDANHHFNQADKTMLEHQNTVLHQQLRIVDVLCDIDQ